LRDGLAEFAFFITIAVIFCIDEYKMLYYEYF
jgi:hypothetical protein